MAKYSDKFKIQIVMEYLDGKLGFKRLADKHGLPNRSVIQTWVRNYKEFGLIGLSKKQNKQVYSVQFKLTVLNFMKQTGASYQDTASEFKLMNRTLIASWQRKFLNEGIEGLEEKSKGRPPMSKKTKIAPVNQEKTISREEQLERENELLRLEVAYLKKLKAFRENPDAFLEKHKQQSPLNSKKKDTD